MPWTRSRASTPRWALALALALGCTGTQPAASPPVGPTVETAAPPAPRPLAEAVARLPRSIVGLKKRPASWLLDQANNDLVELDPGCWRRLVDRVAGYYSVEVHVQAGEGAQLNAIDAAFTTADIAACRPARSTRRQTKDARIVVVQDAGFFPWMFASVADGWTIAATGPFEAAEQALTALLAEPPTTTNPLRRLVAEPFRTQTWAIHALDYTSAFVGVASLGLRVELPIDHATPDEDGGPASADLLFKTDDDASLALLRWNGEDPFGDRARLVAWSDQLAARGRPYLDGSVIRFRGTFSAEDSRSLFDHVLPFLQAARSVAE